MLLKYRAMLFSSLLVLFCMAISQAILAEQVEFSKDVLYSVSNSKPSEGLLPIKKLVFSNVSSGTYNVRYSFNIQLIMPAYLSKDYVQAVSSAIVKIVSATFKVNAIVLFLYDSPDISDSYTLARVFWAPKGDWGEASSVSPGDYSKHNLKIDFADKYKSIPDSLLTEAYSFPAIDLSFEDLSVAGVIRHQYRTWIDVEKYAVTTDFLKSMAQSILFITTSIKKINALSMFIYDNPDATGVYTVAAIDWAPNGNWGDARLTSPGDYSKHRFKIMAPFM